ncbi:UPF0481 protein [Camellia lanceoleosa]|uniref:UPF0481 protein n=1 Tax=Camellia lanceoleosa TaxID=1840588 RepID=A0ACC0H2Z4_9ERIC|nr:UPF0481 protein [Camellia lanceoleosa]
MCVSNHNAYTPQLVSIGPYHHGDPKLAAMEVHKKRYLNSILKRTNQVTVEPYIKAMMALEGRARDYYANPIVLDQDEFIEMMVLDGCFVIEFLGKLTLSAEMRADDPIFQASWMELIVARDLVVLIENQLPFFVLSKLYDMIDGFPDIPFSSFMEDCIINFLGDSIPISNSDNSSAHTSSPDTPRKSEGSKHFLDLMHKVCAPSTGYANLMMTSDGEEICVNIPCVVELQEAGVKFRPGGVKEGGGGDGICIFDIDFEGGQMTIPKIDVGRMTQTIFHNMVAYEQYTSDFEPKYFTSYTFFMHLLINSEKDVNQLCCCNIFYYKACNDQGVARMFEALGEGRVLMGNSFYLSKLCKDVNAHCDKSWNKLMARLRRDYFYSSWASISTFAAAFLILLTVIQTVVALITLLG